MKQLIICLLALLCLSSCGVFKKRTSHVESVKVDSVSLKQEVLTLKDTSSSERVSVGVIQIPRSIATDPSFNFSDFFKATRELDESTETLATNVIDLHSAAVHTTKKRLPESGLNGRIPEDNLIVMFAKSEKNKKGIDIKQDIKTEQKVKKNEKVKEVKTAPSALWAVLIIVASFFICMFIFYKAR